MFSALFMDKNGYPEVAMHWEHRFNHMVIDGLDDLLMEDSGEIIKDAMKGLRELEDDGFAFVETPAMRRVKEEFIGQYNSFALFAQRFIVADTENVVTSDEIQRRYKKFCKEYPGAYP